MSVKIEGIDDLLAVLKRVPGLMDRAIESSLTKEAFDIMAESQRVVPRKTGRLRASKAVDVSRSPRGWTATLGYGGDASEYALYQHELHPLSNPAYINPNVQGTQAKFLEGPVMAARATLGRDLGALMRPIIQRGVS